MIAVPFAVREYGSGSPFPACRMPKKRLASSWLQEIEAIDPLGATSFDVITAHSQPAYV